MKRTWLFVFIISFSFAYGYENDWYYGTTVNGEDKEFYGSPDMHSDFLSGKTKGNGHWENRLLKIKESLSNIEEKIKSEKDELAKALLIENRNKLFNDKARCYIYLDRVDEALQILLNVEQHGEPDSVVAENLAVCYDLKNDYEKALQWIEKSFNRNQMAIYSNLWVYEKILQTKSALQKDKNYLENNTVLGLPISKSENLSSVSVSKLENFQVRWIMGQQAKQIKEQIKIQFEIHEGVKDIVLIHLIEELATIYALGEVCEVALPLYELALKMGHPDTKLLENRINQMKKVIEANPESMKRSRSFMELPDNLSWFHIIGGLLLFILLVGVWVRSRYFNK